MDEINQLKVSISEKDSLINEQKTTLEVMEEMHKADHAILTDTNEKIKKYELELNTYVTSTKTEKPLTKPNSMSFYLSQLFLVS